MYYSVRQFIWEKGWTEEFLETIEDLRDNIGTFIELYTLNDENMWATEIKVASVTEMATMSMHVWWKPLKNLLQNPMPDVIENWFAVSVTQHIY